jgi:hypothetical protein
MTLASPEPCPGRRHQAAASGLSDVAAQTVDQRLQMGKAAEPAEARGGFSNSVQVKA